MFKNTILDLNYILRTIKKLDSEDIDKDVKIIKNDLLENKLKILEEPQERKRNTKIRKIYNKEMNILDSKKSMFNDKKQEMLQILSEILENTNKFINKIDSVSIDNEIEDYIRFLNKGKIGTLETLTRDIISKYKIEGITDAQKTVINQSHGGNARRTKKYRKK
jgi:malonyl CoA-acyl carrier protein transacylase